MFTKQSYMFTSLYIMIYNIYYICITYIYVYYNAYIIYIQFRCTEAVSNGLGILVNTVLKKSQYTKMITLISLKKKNSGLYLENKSASL